MKNKLITLILFVFLAVSGFAKDTIKIDVKGEGNPLVFIPAMGCPGEIWDQTIEHFSSNYKCYTITIQGFGTTAVPKNTSFEQIKSDIISFLKKNKVHSPVLIGHSFGASLAMELASENPGLFSKLILIDTYSFPLDVFVQGISLELAQSESEKLVNAMLKLTDEEFKSQQSMQLATAIADDEIRSKILSWQLNSDRKLLVEAMGRMLRLDHRPELKDIKIPTLIIGTWSVMEKYGFTMESTRKTFEDQYKNLPNHKIVMAAKGQHFIMFDEPDWFNQQLDLFLQ